MTARRIQSRRWLPVLLAGIVSAFALGGTATAEQIDNAPGPITRLLITPDLNCGVSFLGDSSPEFFGDTACATFISTPTELFGPTSIPAGGAASPRTGFTPVSQTRSGAGTSGDPFRIETVVDAGASGLRVTQVDTYTVGQNAYRTQVSVVNNGSAAVDLIIYHAADCFLQDSDEGFGAFDPTTGAVSCVNGIDNGSGTMVPGPRIEQFIPLSSGSRFFESGFSAVWAGVGSRQPFPDLCAQCANFIDNGMGLSWSVAVPQGATVSRSLLTNFSPLGLVPLTTVLTATPASVNGLDVVTFTATAANPNAVDLNVDSLSVTLPAGFTYLPGSTTGATTVDPSITGTVLTFTGPFATASGGSQSVTFRTTAVNTPGVYTSSVEGLAGAVPVLPASDTATVTVVAAAQATTTTALATTTAAVAPRAIARTGRGDTPLALLGLVLVGVGLPLVAAAERRRRLATGRHFAPPQ